MYREIITANSPTYEIRIPEEMRGKKIEILAFEIENENPVANGNKSVSSEDFFVKHRIDLSNFKFNREEANDYE
jgi:hypothetical protein